MQSRTHAKQVFDPVGSVPWCAQGRMGPGTTARILRQRWGSPSFFGSLIHLFFLKTGWSSRVSCCSSPPTSFPSLPSLLPFFPFLQMPERPKRQTSGTCGPHWCCGSLFQFLFSSFSCSPKIPFDGMTKIIPINIIQ